MIRMIVIAGLSSVLSAYGETGEVRAPVFKASGKVTFEGKPLAGALVVFRKAEVDPKIPSPMATTAEDGSFTLHTYEPDDGAPSGDYLVAVSTAPVGTREGGGYLGGKRKPTDDLLKGHYADPKTSGLKATIKPGENTLEPFDLKAKSGAAVPPPSSTGRDR